MLRALCSVPCALCCALLSDDGPARRFSTSEGLSILRRQRRGVGKRRRTMRQFPGSRSGYRYRPSGRMKQDSREPGGRSQVLFLAWSTLFVGGFACNTPAMGPVIAGGGPELRRTDTCSTSRDFPAKTGLFSSQRTQVEAASMMRSRPHRWSYLPINFRCLQTRVLSCFNAGSAKP